MKPGKTSLVWGWPAGHLGEQAHGSVGPEAEIATVIEVQGWAAFAWLLGVLRPGLSVLGGSPVGHGLRTFRPSPRHLLTLGADDSTSRHNSSRRSAPATNPKGTKGAAKAPLILWHRRGDFPIAPVRSEPT